MYTVHTCIQFYIYIPETLASGALGKCPPSFWSNTSDHCHKRWHPMAHQDSLQLLSFSLSTMWAQFGCPEPSTLEQLPDVTSYPQDIQLGVQWSCRPHFSEDVPHLWRFSIFVTRTCLSSGDRCSSPEAVASLIYCTIPLWGTFLSVIFLNEKLGLQRLGLDTERQENGAGILS